MYPLPPLIIVIEVITPPLTVAIAVAAVPAELDEKLITGAVVYPLPPSIIEIEETTPPTIVVLAKGSGAFTTIELLPVVAPIVLPLTSTFPVLINIPSHGLSSVLV